MRCYRSHLWERRVHRDAADGGGDGGVGGRGDAECAEEVRGRRVVRVAVRVAERVEGCEIGFAAGGC